MNKKTLAIGIAGSILLLAIIFFVPVIPAQQPAATAQGDFIDALDQQGLLGESTVSPEPQPSYKAVDPKTFNLTGKVPRGNPNASVMIVDFSDIGCPFSAKARDNLKQAFIDFPNDVVLYFYSFPPHQNAIKAHEGLECAKDQGKFWEFHDIAFEKRANLTRDDLVSYAKQIGLNETLFASCLDSGEMQKRLAYDYLEADLLGVDGTPFFYINGKPYPGYGDYENFKQLIQQALDEAKK